MMEAKRALPVPGPAEAGPVTAPMDHPRWPWRFALGALLFAIPLFAFGGIVTTIGAGMAVQGWLNAEGHFLPLFPIDLWLRDFATFVEHTHRQFGMLVGLCAVAGVVASHLGRVGRVALVMSWVTLGAVCFQGFLGGQRVVLVSSELAFVHGGVAQLVFAVLGLHMAVQGRTWRARAEQRSAERAAVPVVAAAIAVAFVYGQIWLGAWYRHGLRGTGLDVTARLHLHLGFAVAAALAVGVLAVRLRRVGGRVGNEPLSDLARTRARRLEVLLGLQVCLGFAAWLSRGAEGVTVLETVSAVGHVLVGAGLLASCVVALAWCLRWRSVEPSRAAGDPGSARLP